MPPVSRSIDSDLNSRLLSLTQDGSYTLTQINGQRVFRKNPNFWSGPEPQRECEIFIGRIPHDCFEDELIPLFQLAGELFEFRLMINFSGWNRGYAFAMYVREADTINAIIMFNNYVIRPSWELGVCQSINNCRIFIRQIPPTTSTETIIRIMYALTEEVKLVSIRRAAASSAAIVEYKSHRGAAMARKALVAATVYAWGLGVKPTVAWSMNHSEQLLNQYREMGCLTPEGEVKLWYKEEVASAVVAAPTEVVAPPVIAAPSYVLQPRQQERRMRMIHDAQHRPNSAGHASPDSPNAGQYNASPYNAGPYNAGPYNAGPYNAGPYNAGPTSAGHSKPDSPSAGHSKPDSPSAGPYNAGLYSAGPNRAGHSSPDSPSAGNFGVVRSRYDGRLVGLPALMPPPSQPNPQWTNGYGNIASNECNGSSVYSVVNNGQAMAENGVWLLPKAPPTATALATASATLTFNGFDPWTATNPLSDSINQKNGSSSK